MGKLTNADWWLGRTPEQRARKRKAVDELKDIRTELKDAQDELKDEWKDGQDERKTARDVRKTEYEATRREIADEWKDTRSALFKKRKPSETTVQIYGGSEWLEVKGEAAHQSVLESIAGPKTEEGYDLAVEVVLIREPDNEYDKSAIAVHAVSPQTGEARKVGYVAKETAAKMAPALDKINAAGETVGLEGYIRGGWIRDGDEGHYGIWLLYDPSDFGLDWMGQPK